MACTGCTITAVCFATSLTVLQATTLQATLQELQQALQGLGSPPKQQQQEQTLQQQQPHRNQQETQMALGSRHAAESSPAPCSSTGWDMLGEQSEAAAAAAARVTLAARGTVDSAGHVITPSAAAAAAAALEAAAAHQQQQQQARQQWHSCAFCGESFPSADAYWAHCVMPHHLLQLLVRAQQQLGHGQLGLPALPGWWRQPHQESPAAAAAVGTSGNDDGDASQVPAGRCCAPCSDEWMGEAQLLAHLM
jgi:hypothetical protein